MKKAINNRKWIRVAYNDGSSVYTYMKSFTHKVTDVYHSGFIYRCVKDLSKLSSDEGYYRFYRIDVRLR